MAEGREFPDGAEPGRSGLWLGILVYRWIALAWMIILALGAGDFRRPELAWAAIGGVALWSVWFTVSRGWQRQSVRWFDLGLSVTLLLISGLVMKPGDVAGDVPFFATAYPVASAMTIAAAPGRGGGLAGGLASGFGLAVALALSRPLNGLPIEDLTLGEVAGLANGAVYYLAAGGAVGLMSRVLTRSGAELRKANEALIRERERAARMAERESLGRQIHDSVLQALTLVNKRGKELAARAQVPGADVRQLAEIADQQERALRALIQREPEEAPAGTVPLRTVLQAATYGVTGVPVTVTTVEPMWLSADDVEELSAAVRQALENVVRHARATRATVFAEEENGEIVVSVRDDGVGFEYDEQQMRREGKLGVLKSMKGRIEELGGVMRITSAPGGGTEVEFRVPGVRGAT